MIRNIIVPRVLGKTPEEVQPALELFRALGATPGRDCEGGEAYGFQLEAPRGTVEFLAASQPPVSDLAVEVSDADAFQAPRPPDGPGALNAWILQLFLLHSAL